MPKNKRLTVEEIYALIQNLPPEEYEMLCSQMGVVPSEEIRLYRDMQKLFPTLLEFYTALYTDFMGDLAEGFRVIRDAILNEPIATLPKGKPLSADMLARLNQVMLEVQKMRRNQRRGPSVRNERKERRNDLIRRHIEAGEHDSEKIHAYIQQEDPSLLKGHGGKQMSADEMMRYYRRDTKASA